MTNNYDILDTSHEAMRYHCRTNLFYLCQLLFPDVTAEPHLAMCRFLENAGNPIPKYDYDLNRSAFKVRPTSKLLVGARAILKTTLKQARMVQLGLQNPNLRILDVLSTQPNAEIDLGMVRALFDNPILRELFADIIPSEQERKHLQWSSQYICLKRTESFAEPTFTAAGIGANLVSRHYNVIIPDDICVAKLDTMSREEMRPSALDINKAIGWHQIQLNGLMELKPAHRGDPEVLYPPEIISLNNRWSLDDYVEYVETKCPEFNMLVVPIKWPQEHADPEKAGQPSWPSGPRGTLEDLKSLEESLSSYIWTTQYLCSPTDPKEHLFKQEWIKYYSFLPPDIENTVGMMDLGLSLDKSACYTAIIIVAQDKDGFWYVVDTEREHADTKGQLDMFFRMAEFHKPSILAIENVLFQEKFLDIVRDDPRYPKLAEWGVMFTGEKPVRHESKEQRIEALQPRVRNGNLLFKKNQQELINEMVRYRRNSNSIRDLIDALSYIPRLLFPTGHATLRKSGQEQSWNAGIPYEEIERQILASESPGIFQYIDDSFN